MDIISFVAANVLLTACVLMAAVFIFIAIPYLGCRALISAGVLPKKTPDKEFVKKPRDDRESDLVADWQNSSDCWPEWVKGRVESGKIVLGAQLPTKDGRRIGNAVVYALSGTIDLNGEGHHVYEIITDAGSSVKMIEEEIAGAFYPPEWIIDINTHAGVQKHLARSDSSA